MKTIKYRCVLVQANSREVLVCADSDRNRLPRVRIPAASRPAQQLQRAIYARWQLDVFVLDAWTTPNGLEGCAVAEVVALDTQLFFKEIPITQIKNTELTEEESSRIGLLLESQTSGPTSHPGWIKEAIAWIECVTGRTFRRAGSIEQWNGGGGFALLRASSDDGRTYWLKAAGEPNAHEFTITQFLAETCPDSLPKVIAVSKYWNAWITEDAGNCLNDHPDSAELEMAARCISKVQLHTIGRTEELLALGAYDHRLSILRSHIDDVFAFLINAMGRQISTKVARLSRERLLELSDMLRDACFHLEALAIPDTLIHNDLSTGNILLDDGKCAIIDWSEAAVGVPFLSCARLGELNPAHGSCVNAFYESCWKHRLNSTCMQKAIALAPIVAMYAYLYGRGAWLKRPDNVRVEFESYTRSLARHMDRAARNPFFLETLCQ